MKNFEIKGIATTVITKISELEKIDLFKAISNPETLCAIKGVGMKNCIKIAQAIKAAIFGSQPKSKVFHSADLAEKIFAQKNAVADSDVYHKSERMKWYIPSFKLEDCFGHELADVISQLEEKPIVSVRQGNYLLQKLLRVGANEPFKAPEHIEMLRMGPSEAQRCLGIADGETVDNVAKVNWVLNTHIRFGEDIDNVTHKRFLEQFEIALKTVSVRAKAHGIPYAEKLLKFYCFSSSDTKYGDAVFSERDVGKKLLTLSCAGRDPRQIMKDMAEAKFFTWLSLVFTTSEPISRIADNKIVIDGKPVKAVIVDDIKDVISIPEVERVTKESGLTREKNAEW